MIGNVEQPLSSPTLSALFVTAKGRKFGAWIDADSRDNGYNSGDDLIDNPVYIIESILRDVLGLTTAAIDIASFDDLGNTSNGKRDDWLAARSLIQQEPSNDVVSKLAYEAGIIQCRDHQNKEKVVALDHYNPTDQLNNADIALDENKIPMVRVRQTHVKYIRNEFYLNYRVNHATGNYDGQMFVNASTHNLSSDARSDSILDTYTGVCSWSQTAYNTVQRWTYNADWIRDDITAEKFIKLMIDWLAIRHWEIETDLLYSAKTLKLEIGDQVKWLLSLLPMSMQDVKPLNVAAAGSTASGSLAAGTYYYVVTALDAHGETMASEEKSATIAATGHIDITWDSLTGAHEYRVWGRTTGAQDRYWTVAAGTAFADTGQAPDDSDVSPPAVPPAFFVTRCIDAAPNSDGKIHLNFLSCPTIFFLNEGYGYHPGENYGINF